MRDVKEPQRLFEHREEPCGTQLDARPFAPGFLARECLGLRE